MNTESKKNKTEEILDSIESLSLEDKVEVLANVFIALGVNLLNVDKSKIKNITKYVLDDLHSNGETLPNALARQGLIILSWLSKEKVKMKYPGTFTIYKKLGAAQFTLINPKVKQDSGRIDRDGAVLLEASKGAGDKKYLWSEKISFALGMSDLCSIFDNPDEPQRLVHSMPGSDTVKALEFKPGEGVMLGPT